MASYRHVITASATFVVGIAALVLSVLFGIYALVPHMPWKERDIATGVCLLVFAGFTTMGAAVLTFFVVGALVEGVQRMVECCHNAQ